MNDYEVQVVMDGIMRSNPDLNLDLTPHCRAEEQKIRLTVKMGEVTVVQDHIQPNVDWHILFLMQHAIIDAFSKGVNAGKLNALNTIDKFNHDLVFGIKR